MEDEDKTFLVSHKIASELVTADWLDGELAKAVQELDSSFKDTKGGLVLEDEEAFAKAGKKFCVLFAQWKYEHKVS